MGQSKEMGLRLLSISESSHCTTAHLKIFRQQTLNFSLSTNRLNITKMKKNLP